MRLRRVVLLEAEGRGLDTDIIARRDEQGSSRCYNYSQCEGSSDFAANFACRLSVPAITRWDG